MPLPQVNTTFQNKYVLKSVLGQGGFATVFLGVDDIADRRVAIKIIDAVQHGANSGIEERFVREVRVLSSLRDPHTVTMHDYGRADGGLLYMVFEYIEGRDLEQLLEEQGTLTEAQVVHLLVQVLHSLREAHAAGLLHRDLKPANIRVFEYMGDPLRAKLLDFGIAREASPQDSKITQDGVMIGTPKYMAPEQVFGDTLTPASDIYSLGLVAYEMIAGRAAIDAPSTAEILRLQASLAPIVLPSDLPVSPPFREVLTAMLVKHPRQRAQSATDLLAKLEAMQSPATQGGPIPTLDLPAAPPRSTPSEMGSGALRPVAPTGGHRPPTVSEPAQPRHDQPPPPTAVNESATEVAGSNLVLVGALVVLVALIIGAVIVLYAKGEDRADEPGGPITAPLAVATPNDDPTDAIDLAKSERNVAVLTASQGLEARDDSRASSSAPEGSGCGESVPSGTRKMSTTFEGSTRRWVARPPADYDENAKHPLLILFHDTRDGVLGQFLTDSQFAGVADQKGLVIISPQSRSGNHGDAAPSPSWLEPVHELAFARELILRTKAEFCIDESKIFVVGHGTGGKMADEARCSLPVAAVGMTSWRLGAAAEPCVGNRAVPIVQMWGREDGFNTREGGKDCHNSGDRRSLASHEDVVAAVNGCSSRTTGYGKAKHYKCKEWEGCDAGTISCEHNGGHGWPGTQYHLGEQMFMQCFGTQPAFDLASTMYEMLEREAAESARTAE